MDLICRQFIEQRNWIPKLYTLILI